MISLWIVEHLVLVEHLRSGVCSGFVKLAVYPLPLEQNEEILRGSFVVAVAASAHPELQIIELEE